MTLKNEVEALLFASGRYMTTEDISDHLGKSKKKVKETLEELKGEYEKSDSSLTFIEANDNWKMSVKEDFQHIVQQIVADTELSTPVLETLAVIAWKRPVLQSEVKDIRGTASYDHIKELMDLGFLTREKHGRTYKLKLDNKFFDYFDVEGDEEIKELFSNVERPEAEIEEEQRKKKEKEQKRREELQQLEVERKEDPVEKRKREQKELEELDKEIETISERAEEHIEDIDEYAQETEADEHGEGEEDGSEESENKD